MNADKLLEHLENPGSLYQLSFAELESLTREFPFSRNLHVLLFTKAWLEKHPDAEQLLQRVSMFSTCRRSLYLYVQSLSRLITQYSAAEEDYEVLELKDLHTLSREKQPSATEAANANTYARPTHDSFPLKKKQTPPPISDRAAVRKKLEDLFTESFSEQNQPPLVTPSTTQPLPIKQLRRKPGIENQPPAPQPEVTPPMDKMAKPEPTPLHPLPKSNFASWQTALGRRLVEQRLRDLHQQLFPSTIDAASTTPVEVPEMARQSISDNLEIASETYAQILIQQQEYLKAIAVYQRLILKFPEKTPFFAGKIESLKKYLT